MAQETADHCTNPSEEVIRVGHLTVHFLVTGENSSGTVAVFEVVVPAGQRLMAPHSHDHYEETVYGIDGVLTWTVDGKLIGQSTQTALQVHQWRQWTDRGRVTGNAEFIPRGRQTRFSIYLPFARPAAVRSGE